MERAALNGSGKLTEIAACESGKRNCQKSEKISRLRIEVIVMNAGEEALLLASARGEGVIETNCPACGGRKRGRGSVCSVYFLGQYCFENGLTLAVIIRSGTN